MSLLDHAKTELALLRSADEPDEMQDAMDSHILKMVELFAQEGHSGFSASYATNILEKLLRFEPLKPLTGEEGEWVEVANGDRGPLFQNKRCSRVFKDDAGAWDIDGIIWRDPDGSCFTNYDSRLPVTFPYTPKTEVRDRPQEAA